MNCCVTLSPSKGTMPYDRNHGTKAHIGHLKLFGSKDFVHKVKAQRFNKGKYAMCAQPGVLVRYEGEHRNIYMIYLPKINNLVRARDFSFIEIYSLDELMVSWQPKHYHLLTSKNWKKFPYH